MKVKLIWDFYGDEALEYAQHHTVHLTEFISANTKYKAKSGYETVNEKNHAIAYIICDKEDMIFFRDKLLPKRAEVSEE